MQKNESAWLPRLGLHDVLPSGSHEEAVEDLRQLRDALFLGVHALLVFQQELDVLHHAPHRTLMCHGQLRHQVRQVLNTIISDWLLCRVTSQYNRNENWNISALSDSAKHSLEICMNCS